jgi:hypothetical protein
MPQFTPTQTSNSVPGVALQGRVHGGQQPVVGASVYLYAANTTGYGNASVSLLKAGAGTSQDGSGNYYVTTVANGAFSITGDYTCPAPTSQVYLYSVGGSAGSGTNSAIGLLAALGTCSTLKSTQFAFVDEVSTVATAFAIAGYATDATHVSSSGSALALTGIANAFATVQNLETLGTGVALATTPNGNGTAPQAEVNTLADVLAACVNSTSSSSTGCSTLFSNAMSGSTTPTDTATAAINIAHNPGANAFTLYELASATSPFQPILTTPANDWTMGISYSATGLTTTPFGLAVDASGNVWVTGGTFLCEFSPLGVPTPSSCYTGGGLADAFAVAIDSTGNVWVTNSGGGASAIGSVSEFSSTGSVISTGMYGYTAGNLDFPYGIAIDGNGNVWIANGGRGLVNDLTEYDSSGSNVGSSPYSGGGMNGPIGVAVDTSNNIWVGNSSNSISEISSGGSPISPATTGYSGGGLGLGATGTAMVAIDASGNVWTVNYGSGGPSGNLTELSSSGSAISPSSGYTGGGLTADPCCLAIDGAGNVWVPNSSGATLSEFSSSGTALSPFTGFQSSDLYITVNGAPAIAVDGSGNLWMTNNDLGTLVEVVGAASPVVTPIVANLKSPYGMHAVNKP